MLKRAFIFIVYNLVCLAIEISLDSIEKTIHNYNDLLNLGDNYRLVRYNTDNVTYHNAKIIFNKWPSVQQIVTRVSLYTLTCDENTDYIDEMDSTTLKPKRYAVHVIIGKNIKFNNEDYDVNLYRCLQKYCSFRSRRQFGLNCSNNGVKKLLIKSDVQSCCKKVYDVNFQNNHIEEVALQSFMEVFIFVVRLDLRKNPILTFAYDSFKPMKLLRFLYVPYVTNVVDEDLVERLMEFNTHLLFVECTMDAYVVFSAWNDYCTGSGVGFYLNYQNRGVIETQRAITERTIKIVEGTSKVTKRNKVSRNPTMTTADNETDLTWLWYAFAGGMGFVVVKIILKLC